MKRKNELHIPTKIIDSDDHIQGIANEELAVTGIAAAAAVVLGICIDTFSGNMFLAVVTAVGLISVTVFLIRRDMCNENVFQKLKILWKNAVMQQRYKYQYWNIYEDIFNEENSK